MNFLDDGLGREKPAGSFINNFACCFANKSIVCVSSPEKSLVNGNAESDTVVLRLALLSELGGRTECSGCAGSDCAGTRSSGGLSSGLVTTISGEKAVVELCDALAVRRGSPRPVSSPPGSFPEDSASE